MFKKIIKSILKESLHKKKYSSSDAWKHRNHRKDSNHGHSYYKRKRKSGFFSSFSSFS